MTKRVSILCCVLLFSSMHMVHGHNYTITGGWNLTIDAADMIGGAGSDLTSDYVSAANAVLMDITGTIAPAEPWTITIAKSDVDWDGTMHLSVQRTSDGTGTGTITGGTSWIELTSTAQTIFQGTEDRTSVQLQLMLSGVSVTVGAQVFTTQMVFTLLDS